MYTAVTHYRPTFDGKYYGNTGCVVFKRGGKWVTKLERFLPQNQHTQRKFLNQKLKKYESVFFPLILSILAPKIMEEWNNQL